MTSRRPPSPQREASPPTMAARRLSNAELELLEHVRGAYGVAFALVIQCDISEWMVTAESREPDPIYIRRGTGRSFSEAWNNLCDGRSRKVAHR